MLSDHDSLHFVDRYEHMYHRMYIQEPKYARDPNAQAFAWRLGPNAPRLMLFANPAFIRAYAILPL